MRRASADAYVVSLEDHTLPPSRQAELPWSGETRAFGRTHYIGELPGALTFDLLIDTATASIVGACAEVDGDMRMLELYRNLFGRADASIVRIDDGAVLDQSNPYLRAGVKIDSSEAYVEVVWRAASRPSLEVAQLEYGQWLFGYAESIGPAAASIWSATPTLFAVNWCADIEKSTGLGFPGTPRVAGDDAEGVAQ